MTLSTLTRSTLTRSTPPPRRAANAGLMFHGFFAAGALLACAIACGIVWVSTSVAFDRFSRKSVAQEADSAAYNLASYLADRSRTLKAIASDRDVRASVFGSGSATEAVRARLNDVAFYADQRRLTLFSLTMESIVDEGADALGDAARHASDAVGRALAVTVIETGALRPQSAHFVTEAETTFVIAAPVLSGGQVEGVLVGQFAYDPHLYPAAASEPSVKTRVDGAVSLVSDQRWSPGAGERWLEIRSPIAALGAEHVFFRNVASLDSLQLNTMAKTAGALALGLLIAFGALAATGRSLMLNPYRALEASRETLAETNQALQHTALHDALTGLPNRRYLDDTLRALTVKAREDGAPLAILHIDLDRFKDINDTLGHAAGDRVLETVGERLGACVRPGDFVARIGGDEFVILIHGEIGRAGLEARARSVIDQLSQPVPFEQHLCRFGASVGVAQGRGPELCGAQLLVDADIALYRAKDAGRNGFVFFTEAEQEATARRKAVADDIIRALEEGAFEPFYQPQVDAKTLEVIGVEALARWRHPEQGLMTPDKFLPIADEMGVLAEIDDLILRRVLQDLPGLAERAARPMRASVNVSPRRLEDGALLEKLSALRLPRGAIAFELLESIFLEDDKPLVRANIDGLREMGVAIEIDDFGTGHASVMGLLSLKPDRLKIDRRFVTPATECATSRRVLASLIEIGDALNIAVVAEGVETVAHAALLRDLGCEALQGYAIAKPMPSDAFALWLSQRGRDAISA